MLKLFATLFVFFAVAVVFGQNPTDNEARARTFINVLAGKDFASAYDFFADEVKAQISAEAVSQIWAQVIAEYGEFRSLKELKKAANGRDFIARLEFKKKSENFVVAFNEQGKILGFTVAPPDAPTSAEKTQYAPPTYADVNSFTETEATVGAGGEWILPATLTMPKGKTNVPAIVLVHGSGPQDRDETIGGNKIFKDLAWGLASRGIAVLRYEKRTRQYAAKLAAVKDFTVGEETVDDAALAAQLLMRTPGVDAKKVFVLGHSLGGYLIPRIATKEKAIAGFVIFAGATRSIADVLPEQYAYVFGLDGAISVAEQAQIDEVKKFAAKIKSFKESDRSSGKIYFGAPVSYYLDLQNYDPPQSAAKLKQPIFVLQGESDYQVTMQDFANWKSTLASKKNATFKSYPNLTHLFMETTVGGKPSPKDYEKASHVNETVVKDIADWILKTATRRPRRQ